MAGGIYTREKCPICKGPMKHDERKRGCFCPEHGIPAQTFFIKFKGVFLNFKDYGQAYRKLTGMRYEDDCGRFDPNDHKKDQPNGFKAMAELYLVRKEAKKSYSHIELYIYRAVDYFQTKNVKDITGAHVEDFLYSIKGIGEKTRANHASQLHDFFTWLLRREVILKIPPFPEIEFELGRRKITDWETQAMVISKVREMSAHVNEKIGFGCELLATYTALRPDDLRRIQENSLDADGILIIHNPTKRKNKFKTVRLMPEHAEEWRDLQKQYPSFPSMPFFRHKPDLRKSDANQVFGINLVRKWWNRACKELGLEGVGLYAGTKHTTATETAKILGEERALKASGLTNKAFARYCQVDGMDNLETVTAAMAHKKARVVPLKKKKVQS